MVSFPSQEMQRTMAQHCHIVRPITAANPTSVLTQADIKHPMGHMFYAPVLPHSFRTQGRITGQRRQEKMVRDRDLLVALAS